MKNYHETEPQELNYSELLGNMAIFCVVHNNTQGRKLAKILSLLARNKVHEN